MLIWSMESEFVPVACIPWFTSFGKRRTRSRTTAALHYHQTPFVYFNQGRTVLPPRHVAELVHEVASVPATAAQMAQVIELVQDIRDEAGAETASRELH